MGRACDTGTHDKKTHDAKTHATEARDAAACDAEGPATCGAPHDDVGRVVGDAGTMTAAAMTADERAELIGQLCDSALARAAVYRMLASLYLNKLDAATIESLALAIADGVPIDNPLMAEGYGDMAAFLRDRDGGTCLELAVDFACAIRFEGSQGERRAVPCESMVVTSANPATPTAAASDGPASQGSSSVADASTVFARFAQEVRDDVRRLMREADAEVEDGSQVPEDHLSFECAFMAQLADREYEALADDRLEDALAAVGAQRAMHASHLLPWIDGYCDRLDEAAETRFYRGVSKLTRGYIHEEKDFIDDSYAAIEELIAERR